MEKLLMGIDLGTSACKVALFNKNGEVVASNSGEYHVYHKNPGWAEQDPNEWWEVIAKTIKEMLEKFQIDSKLIKSIGIDGQSWSCIPIDVEKNVLHNTPIWYDTRSASICKDLKETIGEEEIFALCGNPIEPGYTLPKILWFKENAPNIYNDTYKFLQSNSFIAMKLTDSITQDLSQAYGLHCFDMKNAVWSESMCEKMGVDINKLPDIYPCHEVVGSITKTAAVKTGLCEGTPVVAGGLDAACGTLGAGVINNGETQEQGGQAGGMSICMDEYNANEKLILSFHVVPNRWLLQGGSVGGGGAINWFEKEFCNQEKLAAKENNTSSFAEMDKLAQSINAGSDGVVFLPYMAGERSPIWDENAKAVYFGLDFAKSRAHMIKASMEGVAFSLKHNLDTAEKAGAKVDVLRAMGGAANSRLWTQIKADVTGKKIVVPSSDTATTLGAAILAGVGVGFYESFNQAVDMTVKITREHVPDPDNENTYAKNYDVYLKLYQNLKQIMKEQGE